jgi:hypothetical protein
VQVVVQQPGGRFSCGGVIGRGKGAGVFAEQVVQLVTAGRKLCEQVLVIRPSKLRRAAPRVVPSRAAAA